MSMEGRCLQALQEIGEAVTEVKDRRALLDLVITRVVDALGADGGTIRLLDGNGEWLTRVAHHNVDEALVLHGGRIRVAASLGAEAVRTGRPTIIDLRRDSGIAFHQEFRQRGLVAVLIAPLVIRGAVTGTLNLYFRGVVDDDAARMARAQGFARAAAVALDNVRVHHEACQRVRETETLLSVTGIMSSTLELGEVARRAVREMVRLVGADMGGAWVLSVDRHRFVGAAGYRVPPDVLPKIEGMPLLFIHPLVSEVVERKHSVCASHSQMDPLFDHPVLGLLPHKSVMAIPMWRKDDVVGVFVLLWTREYHRFSPAEQRLLEGIARAGAAAIENARLVEAERDGWKAVEASEAKYRALVENVSDIVYSHGFDGRITAANAAASQVTGYTVDELEAMGLAELIAPEDMTAVDAAIDDMATGRRQALSITLEVVCKDGRRRVLECHSRAIVKDGVPAAVQGTAHDVTERCKLERRQAALVEITKEVAAEDDLDGLLALIGRRVCELLEAAATIVFVVEDGDLVLRGGHGIPIPAIPPRWRVADSRLAATVRSGVSRVTRDLTRDREWDASLLIEAGYRGMVEVPIVDRGEVRGVLCALTLAVHAFPSADVALLESLAAHAAIALDRARLVDQMKARLRETETLLAVSRTVGSTLDLTEMMRRVAREAAHTLGADMTGAYLLDASGAWLTPIAGHHVPAPLVELFVRHPVPLGGHHAMHEAWTTGKPAWTSNVEDLTGIDSDTLAGFPRQSCLFIPMMVNDASIGALFAVWWHAERAIRPEELSLVEGIARQAAIMVDHARLFREAKEAREETEALAGLGREVSETLDLDQVLGTVLTTAIALAGADVAWVAVTEDDGSARPRAIHGDDCALDGLLVRPGVGLAGRALASGLPQETADWTAADAARETVGLVRTDIGSALALPLVLHAQPVGVVWLGRRSRDGFDARMIGRLRAMVPSLAIAIQNARLYHQVAAKHDELRDTTQALAEALQTRSEFLANVSHEIRTPLANVLGLLGIILDGLATDAAEQQTFIAEAHANARHLLGLVNDILDMARIEAGKLEVRVEPLDLADLLEEVRALMSVQAEAKGLTLELNVPPPPRPPVMADAMRLHQVFLNLLSNSLKFTTSGRIEIRMAPHPDKGVVTVDVTDTGIGVPLEAQARLFEKFVQVDGSTSRGHGGSGLGLAVSRHLVERMDGVITLRSDGEGLGTTVTVTLPLLGAGQPAVVS